MTGTEIVIQGVKYGRLTDFIVSVTALVITASLAYFYYKRKLEADSQCLHGYSVAMQAKLYATSILSVVLLAIMLTNIYYLTLYYISSKEWTLNYILIEKLDRPIIIKLYETVPTPIYTHISILKIVGASIVVVAILDYIVCRYIRLVESRDVEPVTWVLLSIGLTLILAILAIYFTCSLRNVIFYWLSPEGWTIDYIMTALRK